MSSHGISQREDRERERYATHPIFTFFLGIHPLLATWVRVKSGANLVPVSICIPMLAKIRVKFKKQSN